MDQSDHRENAPGEQAPGEQGDSGFDPELEERFSNPVLRFDTGHGTAQRVAALFVLVLAGLFANAPGTASFFHGRDLEAVAENWGVHDWRTFADALPEVPAGPLTVLTLTTNWLAAPGSPASFFWGNLALHLLCSMAVYAFARRLIDENASEAPALAAGLCFALHPMAVEAVQYALGRGMLMALLFGLAALLCWARATDAGSVRWGWLLASLAMYVFACASDWAALPLPAILLAWDWVQRGKAILRTSASAHAPYWVILATLLMAGWVIKGGFLAGGITPSLWDPVYHAARFTIVPIGLSPWHAAYQDAPLALLIFGVFAIATIAALAVRARIAIPLLWLILLGAWLAIAHPAPRFVEGFAYITIPAAAFALALLLESVRPHATAHRAVGIAVLLGLATLGVMSYQRNAQWARPAKLWTQAIEQAPEEAMPRYYAAMAHLSPEVGGRQPESGNGPRMGALAAQRPNATMTQLRQAANLFGAAVERDPAMVRSYLGLAACQIELSETERARSVLQTAVAQFPGNQDAALLMARSWHRHDGDDREAARHAAAWYRRAERIGALPVGVLPSFLGALYKLGDYDAIGRIQSEHGAYLSRMDAESARQQAKTRLEEVRELGAEAQRAFEANPLNAAGLRTLAKARLLERDFHQAAYALYEAVRSEPENAEGWALLGTALGGLGESGRFLEQWGESVPPAGDGSDPWFRLVRECARLDLWDAAETYLAARTGAETLGGDALKLLADMALREDKEARARHYIERARQQGADTTDLETRLQGEGED